MIKIEISITCTVVKGLFDLESEEIHASTSSSPAPIERNLQFAGFRRALEYASLSASSSPALTVYYPWEETPAPEAPLSLATSYPSRQSTRVN